jgi:CheY-like chemotaxis protein
MLEQVITNLVINARDALPEGGTIEIVLKSAEKEPPPGVEKETRWAVIEVIDHGLGISKDLLPKIFDPFFTTKPAGKGTGLGLATCHGVIRSHGGWLEVETEPGEGTTFRCFLPRICWDIAKREPRTSLPATKPGRVLVVEDEELLARLITRILTGQGYQVLLAGNGQEAIALMKAEKVDLLLTDLSLPGGMTGRELAEYLRGENPSLRVAYMSGYSPDLDDTTFNPELFLPKPFKPEELLDLLRKTERCPG